MAEAQVQQQFALQRIYTKDISFESPGTPDIFRKQWQPKFQLDLNTQSDRIDDQGSYEVVLRITATAKVEADTVYLVEVKQAGIFLINGFEGETLQQLLGTAAPNVLFPYARETIDNLCVKGGFPPMMLAPVNFDALYQRAVQEAAARNQGGGETAIN